MKRLVFANPQQVVLWNKEMSGQVSDGMWENSKPYDHYKDITGADVSFDADPKKQGCFGFYPKRRYNFANTELLSIVGERALEEVQKSGTYPSEYTWSHMVRDLKQMGDIVAGKKLAAQQPVGAADKDIVATYKDSSGNRSYIMKDTENDYSCTCDEFSTKQECQHILDYMAGADNKVKEQIDKLYQTKESTLQDIIKEAAKLAFPYKIENNVKTLCDLDKKLRIDEDWNDEIRNTLNKYKITDFKDLVSEEVDRLIEIAKLITPEVLTEAEFIDGIAKNSYIQKEPEPRGLRSPKPGNSCINEYTADFGQGDRVTRKSLPDIKGTVQYNKHDGVYVIWDGDDPEGPEAADGPFRDDELQSVMKEIYDPTEYYPEEDPKFIARKEKEAEEEKMLDKVVDAEIDRKKHLNEKSKQYFNDMPTDKQVEETIASMLYDMGEEAAEQINSEEFKKLVDNLVNQFPAFSDESAKYAIEVYLYRNKIPIIGEEVISEEEQASGFDQERAWGAFEQFAVGDFNVVADYNYPNIEAFYRSSIEFVPMSKWKKYKAALEASQTLQEYEAASVTISKIKPLPVNESRDSVDGQTSVNVGGKEYIADYTVEFYYSPASWGYDGGSPEESGEEVEYKSLKDENGVEMPEELFNNNQTEIEKQIVDHALEQLKGREDQEPPERDDFYEAKNKNEGGLRSFRPFSSGYNEEPIVNRRREPCDTCKKELATMRYLDKESGWTLSCRKCFKDKTGINETESATSNSPWEDADDDTYTCEASSLEASGDKDPWGRNMKHLRLTWQTAREMDEIRFWHTNTVSPEGKPVKLMVYND